MGLIVQEYLTYPFALTISPSRQRRSLMRSMANDGRERGFLKALPDRKGLLFVLHSVVGCLPTDRHGGITGERGPQWSG